MVGCKLLGVHHLSNSIFFPETAGAIADLPGISFSKVLHFVSRRQLAVMKPAQLYRQLAELPAYVAASFLGPRGMHVRNLCVTVANASVPLALRIITSVRDHTNNRKRTIVKTITLPIGEEEPVISSQEQGESVIASTVSRSGSRIGILKESKEGDKIKRQVEIWRGSTAEAILDVTKEHGEFYGDGTRSLGTNAL